MIQDRQEDINCDWAESLSLDSVLLAIDVTDEFAKSLEVLLLLTPEHIPNGSAYEPDANSWDVEMRPSRSTPGLARVHVIIIDSHTLLAAESSLGNMHTWPCTSQAGKLVLPLMEGLPH